MSEVGQARSSRVPALHVGFPTDSRHDRHMERDWEMSAGSPVIDDVHLQLYRARLVLNQQDNGHEQRGYSR